jgi:hypothetical protein
MSFTQTLMKERVEYDVDNSSLFRNCDCETLQFSDRRKRRDCFTITSAIGLPSEIQLQGQKEAVEHEQKRNGYAGNSGAHGKAFSTQPCNASTKMNRN